MGKMMDAIFLDTGNTMRVVVKDAEFQNAARQKLARLTGAQESPDALCEKLAKRYEAYKKWARETLTQVSEAELWARWMMPDTLAEKTIPNAEQLTRLWIDQLGRRVPRPDLKPTIAELYKRGYLLGIIANSISETEIPDWLKADGLAKYFKAVILSATFRRRKPDPYIYLEAARVAGVEPGRCAYVGDNPNRDIVGAREAGFGMVLILLEQATLRKEPAKGKNQPDGIVTDMTGLLNFFPPRG